MAKQEMDEAAKAKEEEDDSNELQLRRKRRDKRTKTSDLSSQPKGSVHSKSERRNSLGDYSFMASSASSANLSLVDNGGDEKSTAEKDIKAKTVKKKSRQRRLRLPRTHLETNLRRGHAVKDPTMDCTRVHPVHVVRN
jgi:hypothetical protein